MTNTIEIAPPLSEFDGDPRAFLNTLSYSSSTRITPEVQRRWQGDQRLLSLLDQALYRGPLVAIRDLPEDVIRQCVEEVERVHCGEWRLEGDAHRPRNESTPILERLDAHFRPMQEQLVERRREQEADRERRLRTSEAVASDAAERQADAYRRTWGLPA